MGQLIDINRVAPESRTTASTAARGTLHKRRSLTALHNGARRTPIPAPGDLRRVHAPVVGAQAHHPVVLLPRDLHLAERRVIEGRGPSVSRKLLEALLVPSAFLWRGVFLVLYSRMEYRVFQMVPGTV